MVFPSVYLLICVCFCFKQLNLNNVMSSFFEDLTNLVAENPAGRVLAVTLLILVLSAVIAVGLVFLALKLIFPRIA